MPRLPAPRARAATKSLPSAATAAAPEPDTRAALELVMQLMAIPGVSGHEGQIVETITGQLRAAGVPRSAIRTDEAHKRALIRGEVGNLICKLPGTLRGPRRLLMAHVDTVPLCQGSKPVRRGDWIESADKSTGLGADNRAGAAVVLQAVLEIYRRRLPHPPLTLLWPIQEEVGLQGAQYLSLGLLGRPKLAFNWDGGAAERVTIGATGAFRLVIRVHGIASHAGGAPELGVSAVVIAGLAISALHRDGWLGDIRRGESRGTSNIGYVHGGGATNVVSHLVELKAEARSHDPHFRRKIVEAIETAFTEAAAAVRNRDGQAGRVEIECRHDYESFVLAEQEPCVVAAAEAIRSLGATPQLVVSNGGLDANWMSARGIPTVTLGCGQKNAHMATERLEVAPFQMACRVALRLATGWTSPAGPAAR